MHYRHTNDHMCHASKLEGAILLCFVKGLDMLQFYKT